jgi:putative thioredoxin
MSMSGAYDLSSLKRSEPTASSARQPSVTVSSLVQDCTEATLKGFLDHSAQVPVVIEFHADSVRPLEISSRLKTSVEKLGGRLIMARVDAQAEQRVGQAFGVKGAPTVVAIVKGQPVPLFEGDQPTEIIDQVFARVLEVCAENGIVGVARVSDQPQDAEPVLEPMHQKAYDFIEAGNYQDAIATYEQILRENPRDDLATAGLAQVRLLARTLDADFANIPDVAPEELDELFEWADLQVSSSNLKPAFDALLAAFENRLEDRDAIRKHLVELFSVIDPANAELAEARRRLATLLY